MKSLLANKFEGWNGDDQLHARRGPLLAAVDAARCCSCSTPRPDMPFTEAKIIFPPDLKTGDLDAGPASVRAGAGRERATRLARDVDLTSSRSTSSPDWSSASSTA